MLNLEAVDHTKYSIVVARALWTSEELESFYFSDGRKPKSKTRKPFEGEEFEEKLSLLKGIFNLISFYIN